MKDKFERFSALMCVYGKDNPEYFRLAMLSIIEQTVVPSEIVLVVDGPVPSELKGIIQDIESRHSFIKVIQLKKNMGHGEARRIGVQECRYDLVALMDADDISVPYRFEKQLLMMKNNPSIDIVGGNIAEFINTPENTVGRRIVPETDASIKKYMKKRCPLNQVSVLFRKSQVEKAGGYKDWYCNEDYFLWLRMALNGCIFYNCQEILVNVRVGKDMYRRRGGWKYFISEAKLQGFMLKNGIIGIFQYAFNIMVRFILQVMMPNSIRGIIFQKFARS